MKRSQRLLWRGGERTLDIPEEGVGDGQAASAQGRRHHAASICELGVRLG